MFGLVGLSLLLAPSADATSFTWSGRKPGTSESDAHWSSGENWEGDTAPVDSQTIETLVFPHLTNSECTSEPETDTCYATLNNLSGLSVESIHLDDADDYLLAGEPITLGSGGLTATPEASREAGTVLEMPLHLGATQTWHIASGGGELGENGVLLAGGLTGSGNALIVELSNGPLVFLAENDTEVGPVTIDGANTNEVAANGVVSFVAAKLNSSNGEPVSLSHVFFVGSGAVGQLITSDADLDVGSPAEGIEAASVRLDSASHVEFGITGKGSSAHVDYSQLLSQGSVELAGAKIEAVVRPPRKGQPCPTLAPGQKYTFVSAAGQLSGAFSNAPENGQEISIRFATACSQISQTMQIAYHESGGTQTVTGTVEGAAYKHKEEEATTKQKEEEAAKRKREEEALKNPPPRFESPVPESILGNVEAASREAAAKAQAARKAQEEAERSAREAGERAGREAGEQAAAKKKLEEEKAKAKPLTHAQLLAKALKQCKKEKPKSKREKCEETAKKKYGPKKTKKK
jgi:hypothetical protein